MYLSNLNLKVCKRPLRLPSLQLGEAGQLLVGDEHGPVGDPLGLPEVKAPPRMRVAVPPGARLVAALAAPAACIADELEEAGDAEDEQDGDLAVPLRPPPHGGNGDGDDGDMEAALIFSRPS